MLLTPAYAPASLKTLLEVAVQPRGVCFTVIYRIAFVSLLDGWRLWCVRTAIIPVIFHQNVWPGQCQQKSLFVWPCKLNPGHPFHRKRWHLKSKKKKKKHLGLSVVLSFYIYYIFSLYIEGCLVKVHSSSPHNEEILSSSPQIGQIQLFEGARWPLIQCGQGERRHNVFTWFLKFLVAVVPSLPQGWFSLKWLFRKWHISIWA